MGATSTPNTVVFEFHDVKGLLSVAHLFPASKGRTGIYVLHFANGQAYVGQSLNVVGRWASHRRRWSDIVAVEFLRVAPNALDAMELEHIRGRQHRGASLRNIVNAVGDPIASSDLDWIVKRPAQDAWLTNADPWASPDDEVRVRRDDQRLTKRKPYFDLASREDFDEITAVLRTVVQLTLPRPRATELTFWALSALPGTNRSTSPRLAALSINKMETMVLGHRPGSADDLWCFLNVSRTSLGSDEAGLDMFLDRHPLAFTDGESHYEAAGGDSLTLHFAHPGALLETLLFDGDLVRASRALNLRLMRKGPTFQWRGHCFDLADHCVQPFEDEDDTDDEDANAATAQGGDNSGAEYGWVGAGPYQARTSGRRPRVIHASRECIETGRNPRTGARTEARPATLAEWQSAPWCRRCDPSHA